MIERGLSGFWFRLLGVCFLVRLGLAEVPEPAQCLASGIYSLIRPPDNNSALSCWRHCSVLTDCHMAVMTEPLSGPQQCLLVNCLNQGQHSQPRDPSVKISVYPKSTMSDEQRASLESGAYGLADETFRCHKVMTYSSCREGVSKFFYNSTSHRCERFFSGCGYNRNTFDTQVYCEALCSEKYRCFRPMDHGEYPPMHFSSHDPETRDENSVPNFFFFNVSSLKCEAFYFRGSASNGNLFRTVEECESLCGDIRALLSFVVPGMYILGLLAFLGFPVLHNVPVSIFHQRQE